MTGNNKVWRMPVACLASVAMLATMGVSAMTANAAVDESKPVVTLHVDSKYATLAGANDSGELKIQDESNNNAIAEELASKRPSVKDSANYSFTGWYQSPDPGMAYDPATELGGDVDLYAHFAPKTETVHVDLPSNGTVGANFADDFDISYADTVAPWQYATTDATAGDRQLFETYTYDGKNVSLEGKTGNDLMDMIAPRPSASATNKTLALGAVSYADVKTVTYHGGDGWTVDGATDSTIDVAAGSCAPRKVAKHGDMTTDQWVEHVSKKAFNFETTPINSNIQVDVDASGAVSAFTVTYKVETSGAAFGALKNASFTQSVAAGESLPTNADKVPAAKKGFEFLGWTAKSGVAASTAVDDVTLFDGKVTKDMTVYAVYAPTSVTVTYKWGYVTDDDTYTTQAYTNNSTFGYPTDPAREGYVFTGWTPSLKYNGYVLDTTLNGQLKINGKSTIVPLTYTAQWTPASFQSLSNVESRIPESFLKGGEDTSYLDGSDQDVFTAESFDQYVRDWQTYKQHKATMGDLSNDEIAELIAELSGYQNKLVFQLNNPVQRFEKDGLHLYTESSVEADALIANGWKAETKSGFDTIDVANALKDVNGKDLTNADADSTVLALMTKVSRLRNNAAGTYLLTADQNEIDVLTGDGSWKNETFSALYAPANGTTPVYRLYLKYNNEHLVTADANEYEVQSAKTDLFHADGIKFYL